MNLTLDKLKHRVLTVDPTVAESTTGAVITALNEEAVVCAALANKGGINLVVTYEAFAPKMLGAIRQELIFSRHLFEAGRNPSWLTIPIILTSHTWENSKNEQSHQDPTLIEALMGEMADAVYTIFPPDSNGSMAALSQVYRSKGRIAVMVIPKQPIKTRLNKEQAEQLAGDGVIVLHGNPQSAKLLVAATGAYQLEEAIRAYEHLTTHGIDAALIYISEPNRLRTGRDSREREHVIDDASLLKIFPPQTPRVFITHTRPEPFLGVLRRIDTGPATTIALGFINRGGTLDIQGMLFANRSTWAHVVEASASVLAIEKNQLLSSEIIAALAWRGQPSAIFKRS